LYEPMVPWEPGRNRERPAAHGHVRQTPVHMRGGGGGAARALRCPRSRLAGRAPVQWLRARPRECRRAVSQLGVAAARAYECERADDSGRKCERLGGHAVPTRLPCTRTRASPALLALFAAVRPRVAPARCRAATARAAAASKVALARNRRGARVIPRAGSRVRARRRAGPVDPGASEAYGYIRPCPARKRKASRETPACELHCCEGRGRGSASNIGGRGRRFLAH